MGNVTTWQEVALSALNVAQTVLLAYLTTLSARNRESIKRIETRSTRRRSTDHES